MAISKEAVKDYIGSVAERTFGIRAYREIAAGYVSSYNQRKWLSEEAKAELLEKDKFDHRMSSGLGGFLQLFSPAGSKSLFYYLGHDFNENYPARPQDHGWVSTATMVIHHYSSLGLDFGLMLVAATNSHNPVEFVAYKLAINAATHVGLDLARRAVDRFGHFRPSATTLAV